MHCTPAERESTEQLTARLYFNLVMTVMGYETSARLRFETPSGRTRARATWGT